MKITCVRFSSYTTMPCYLSKMSRNLDYSMGELCSLDKFGFILVSNWDRIPIWWEQITRYYQYNVIDRLNFTELSFSKCVLRLKVWNNWLTQLNLRSIILSSTFGTIFEDRWLLNVFHQLRSINKVWLIYALYFSFWSLKTLLPIFLRRPAQMYYS